MEKPVKDVVAALVYQNWRFLIAKRRAGDTFGGFWEFPGGTVDAGESKEEALKREIKEELDVDIDVGREVYRLSAETPHSMITIYLFECKILRGSPRAIDCAQVSWERLSDLKNVNFIPGDKKIVEWLEDKYGER